MNLLVLLPSELGIPLSPLDRRCIHVAKVLGKGAGDVIDVGLLVEGGFGAAPGSLGKARIVRLDEGGLLLDYHPEAEAPRLLPLRIVLGFPRPIQAARILRDLASLGVGEILFAGTELGEKSYLESDFWKKGEWRGVLVEAAGQAANPRLPRVSRSWTLARALEGRVADRIAGEETIDSEAGSPDWDSGSKVYLHPDPGLPSLASLSLHAPLSLAIGSERGWTPAETSRLEAAGYAGASMGSRILRTETASTAGTAIALARLGLL